MNGLNIEAAILAAAGRDNVKVQAAIGGMLSVKEWLDENGAFDTPNRLAHMIGQCAHESMGFQFMQERLSYSAKRLMQVWPRRYPTLAIANQFARNPEKLANHTYGGRMGNTRPGDGYRYRGRGWLQLTGRKNYRARGRALGIDLEGKPKLAIKPGIRWLIAASYLAARQRGGKTAVQWADEGEIRNVTLIVNGGLHGLADREARTSRASNALAA